MKELAKKFIDKECIIASFDGNHQYDGIIKEVTEGAILIEKDGKIEAINLDFVIRIREYPRNEKVCSIRLNNAYTECHFGGTLFWLMIS